MYIIKKKLCQNRITLETVLDLLVLLICSTWYSSTTYLKITYVLLQPKKVPKLDAILSKENLIRSRFKRVSVFQALTSVFWQKKIKDL